MGMFHKYSTDMHLPGGLWFGRWHEEFGKFLREHSKVSNWDFDGILLSQVENVWAVYVSVMYHGNEEWYKIWRETDMPFQNWHHNLTNFDTSIRMSQKFTFNEFLLTKVYNTWAKKVQKSYVWWHWRLMQNLKKIWLVLSKMTWGTWQVFIGWKIVISF